MRLRERGITLGPRQIHIAEARYCVMNCVNAARIQLYDSIQIRSCVIAAAKHDQSLALSRSTRSTGSTSKVLQTVRGDLNEVLPLLIEFLGLPDLARKVAQS